MDSWVTKLNPLINEARMYHNGKPEAKQQVVDCVMETADDVRLKKTCWWKHSVEEGCSVHVDTVWSLRGFYLAADFQASASKL